MKTTLNIITSEPSKAYNKLVKTEAQSAEVDAMVNDLMKGKTFTTQEYNAALSKALYELHMAGKI